MESNFDDRGKLFEGFKILCDHILGKKGETIQGEIFFKAGLDTN